ncbi:glycolipid transfer domain protein (macronuclear) [Tetrahymena thermophila SB210]|uniref:Glycolipid transfer domain protein n=1 Tax=Tetrahymena thermophila (strain SB210) TaxID=312017 RepID=Q236X5_TETTS|nr:glycolipid transfer domain protein [Tetrahymena thermophila SB210]EAR92375.1 glycolipid transfer domain protein [Tetrahymena thermophila SB210]|eukprot:XP_001012620.1 glycolipid transfer domain protein [Tetrahymena thermophila SB210]
MDTHHQESDLFNHQGCVQWLDTIIESFEKTQDFPVEELCKFLHEFCGVFRKMGKLLSMAFSDVDDKVRILRTHTQNYKDECHGQLFAVVKKEMGLNIAALNGENNKKLTKDPKYSNYDSFSRNLLRMMWFQNYLKVMFEELVIDRQQKSSKAFQKAYDFAFSKHHSFMVKAGASLAMSAAPSREKVKELCLGKNGTDEQFYKIMTDIYTRIDKVKSFQWGFYEANNLTALP